ncbi:MAG TPA: PAS domain S-box protein [Allosphingosinicella sp.]
MTPDAPATPSDRRLVTERLQQLFDQAPGFMAVSNGPDHLFEMANQAYCRLVGERDLVGKTAREAFPDLADQKFFELLDHVFASGQAVTGRARPIRLRRVPGAPPEERLLDFVFQPITDRDGTVTGIFAQGHDVTELHQAELALRESEQRFRLIADSAPVPMWVTKLDRKRGFVNIAYAQFLGVPYDEALNFDWRDRVHPDDAERLVAESLAGEATLKPFVLEARYRRGDGAWRWLRSESQPRWGPAGEHIGFIGVAHDITDAKEAEAALLALNETLEKRVEAEVGERLRAEEALRQAQKMEAVGQLTGGIAHDFNNLLTPIMGGLEIIAMRTEDPRLKRIAETGLESARRGAKLTGQLLAFSRIQRISMAPIDVNGAIANMQTLLRHTIGKEIAIETRLDPAIGHGICDENQLENAILNLAINARDAMPDGGTLTIATERSRIDDAPDLQPGDYVCVAVSDTGEGMAPEVLARATEPFFSTKPLGKGTGLGLAQVYGIARQSGGTVRIESELGAGTTVRMLLPEAAAAAPAAATEAEQAAAHGEPSAGATVLIVDDDSDVRAFLAVSLESLGYTAIEAEGGAQGLGKFDEAAIDLILLDFAMPGMNGAEFARLVRQSRPHLPIIFVTGYAESEQLEAALGGGAPVLRKPFTLAQLAAAVTSQLRDS